MQNDVVVQQNWGPHAGSDGSTMDEQASLIQQFINYLRAERHFSPHTSKCYTADLAQFCQYLVGQKCAPHDVSTGGNNGPAERLPATAEIGGEAMNRRLLEVDTDVARVSPSAREELLQEHRACNRDAQLLQIPGAAGLLVQQSGDAHPHSQAGQAFAQVLGDRTDRATLVQSGHHDAAGGARPSHAGDALFDRPARERTGSFGCIRRAAGHERDPRARQGQEAAHDSTRPRGGAGHPALPRHAAQRFALRELRRRGAVHQQARPAAKHAQRSP